MLCLLALLACASRPTPRSPQQPALNQPPPPEPTTLSEPVIQPELALELTGRFPLDYTPTDPGGQSVPFAQWQGQPVLVSVWASWCPPCIEELPLLLGLAQEWGPRGLVMVGVAVDDQASRVIATADARGMSWPQTVDGSNRASVVFETVEMPTTLLYDPAGVLVYKQVGPLVAGDLELTAALAAAVADPGAP